MIIIIMTMTMIVAGMDLPFRSLVNPVQVAKRGPGNEQELQSQQAERNAK